MNNNANYLRRRYKIIFVSPRFFFFFTISKVFLPAKDKIYYKDSEKNIYKENTNISLSQIPTKNLCEKEIYETQRKESS